MRLKQFFALVAVTLFAASAFSNPKCNHRSGGGLFASTNPVKAVKTNSTGGSSSAAGSTGVN